MSLLDERPIALDFETYSDVNIAKQGLDNYINSEHFTPLLAATYEFDGIAYRSDLFDFVNTPHALAEQTERLREKLFDRYIVAHNAAFEKAVLEWMGIDIPSHMFVDTAVLSRASGFGGSLETAAPQVLNEDKHEVGKDLIMLFCVPGKEQASPDFDRTLPRQYPDKWQEFSDYCVQDTKLSMFLTESLISDTMEAELNYSHLTMDMNDTGWKVDLKLVDEMERRYETNTYQLLQEFKDKCNAHDLNLNSSTQLIQWCKDRGVVSKSFDEKNVETMLRRIDRRLSAMKPDDPRVEGLTEVQLMLRTKQELGGSSLKKLDTIKRMTGRDGRLRNQYMHVGAAATFRTSGRGVQMQNLKRLHGGGADVTALHDPMVWWPNGKLSDNLRQVFCASEPGGKLIVGDFSSVESRGLAWQAGEQWKLDAYKQGADLYVVQAAQMLGIPVASVGKSERMLGKVGELACGYGAGPGAVREFAAKMGLEMTEAESAKLVSDWRDANGNIVKYWHNLDDALRRAIETGASYQVNLPYGLVEMIPFAAPESLRDQTSDNNLLSLEFRLYRDNAHYLEVSRTLHGVHIEGRQIQYWKPSERKTGPLWSEKYTDPKTKKTRYYTVYGGKMAGLLTQSLCREVFFRTLYYLMGDAQKYNNLKVIGQFHDEIVMDWVPRHDGISLAQAEELLKWHMSRTVLNGFPLAAEVHSAYRYIK